MEDISTLVKRGPGCCGVANVWCGIGRNLEYFYDVNLTPSHLTDAPVFGSRLWHYIILFRVQTDLSDPFAGPVVAKKPDFGSGSIRVLPVFMLQFHFSYKFARRPARPSISDMNTGLIRLNCPTPKGILLIRVIMNGGIQLPDSDTITNLTCGSSVLCAVRNKQTSIYYLSTLQTLRPRHRWPGIPFIPWHYTFIPYRKLPALLIISASTPGYNAGMTNGEDGGDKTLAVYACNSIKRFIHIQIYTSYNDPARSVTTILR
ncbi:hypothetical protein EDD16DRAFT_959560 [Pisolithus croceorrhizus]|nr:hypothetical protein EDD16DRAFT_959560 [Pisolithus croceorrhizus]